MAKKKSAKKTVVGGWASTDRSTRRAGRGDFVPPENDNLSRSFEALDLVPEDLRGTDAFLDVVTWNIKWFHDRDRRRVDRICDILRVINADVFVFEEILDGSIDTVAERLSNMEAGHYVAHHGTTGGQQRVSMMWDVDWVRSKSDISELFGRGTVMTPDGKDAFPRLPLLGNFSALGEAGENPPFDFQLCGLHLKSQRGGGSAQRQLAAEWLAHWFKHDAPAVDSDIIMLGDWNADVDSDAWDVFRQMEQDGDALFEQINDKSQISHFYYKNRDNIGSRLDLVAVSMVSAEQLVDAKSNIIRWKPLDVLLATDPSAAAIKEFIREIGGDSRGSGGISDHMPVITRFFFGQQSVG